MSTGVRGIIIFYLGGGGGAGVGHLKQPTKDLYYNITGGYIRSYMENKYY